MSDNQRIIEAIAPQLPGGQVQHDSKGAWEWRGTPYDCRTRVQAESVLHCRVQVEAHNPFGAFQLEWSPKYVPDPTAVDNDAFDVSDEVMVWVGRCTVLKCFGLLLDQQLAALHAFPQDGLQYLIDGMQRDHVSVLSVDKKDLTGFVRRDNPDVVGATVRFTNLLAWTGQQLARMAPPATPPAPHQRLRCRYCRALFLLNATSRCPQCGAPAS